MRIALTMIVKGTDEEAGYLDRCLANVAPHVDGIFITRTHMPGEKPNRKVWQVAKKYGAKVSDFEWCYDFSAARNFSFAQVPKDFDYIMWTDADDVWRGLEKLKPTLKKHSSVDAFAFFYLYDWDEARTPTVVHKKTMIVRNDKCVEWVGALHEDFVGTRQLETLFVKGIERLHLVHDQRRFEANAKRNLGIAEREAKIKPEDPRTYWNLGNAQYGVRDGEGAIKTFTKFLKESESAEEKYIAHIRLAMVLKSVNHNEEAIQQLQMAIGLDPRIPDAYFEMAYLYYGMGNYDEAEKYVLIGMRLPPRVHNMIVFNPRDYDYNPMMLAAQIYSQKNRPDYMLTFLEGCLDIYPKDENLKELVREGRAEKKKMEKILYKIRDLQKIRSKEKLRQAMEKLPIDYQSHPAIAVMRNQHFVKTESSGKDITIYCGQTTHEWYDGHGIIGGSEEAVINLSRQFAMAGYNVTVYNTCGHTVKSIIVGGEIGAPGVTYKVTYKPFWLFNYRDRQDVIILWRWAKPLDAELNAPKVFLDLHDVVPAGELNDRRLQKVTKVMVKSQFHRSLFPNVPDHKIMVVPNGINVLSLLNNTPKDPMLVINTSSPDRSMDVLPKLWREVKKQVPKAKLKWAYGWDVFQKSFARDQKKLDWMEQINADMKAAGIEVLGRVSQEQVAQLYKQASILAYPTEFAEIDCISVRKAQAAGCYPIATDFGALAESIVWGTKVHSEKNKDNWCKPYQFHFGLESKEAQDQWVKEMVHHLKAGEKASFRTMAEFDWSEIGARWMKLL